MADSAAAHVETARANWELWAVRVIAAVGFIASLPYLIIGWHYSRYIAPLPQTLDERLAESAVHDIGRMVIATAAVAAGMAVLLLVRKATVSARVLILAVYLAAMTACFFGNRAIGEVHAPQPCACDMA